MEKLTSSRREYMRAYQLAWITKRRDEWIASKGGACVRCGSTKDLEVDHIDRSQKLHEPTALWSRSAAVREPELAKCQVLCADCHHAKTVSELTGMQHGHSGMYGRGCRCDPCKEYNRIRMRVWRASKISNAGDSRAA